MDPDVYKAELIKAHSIAIILESMPLDDMLQAIERAEAAGFVVDPTLYREKMKSVGEDRQLVEILNAAKAKIVKLRAEANR